MVPALGPLLVLVLLSIVLTPMLEADYFILHNFDTEILTVQGFLTRLQDTAWIYALGGLAIFSSYLHYIYDRGAFRFSDPLTRKVALPLLKPLVKRGGVQEQNPFFFEKPESVSSV